MNYLQALGCVHQTLQPCRYVEIGCRKGHSLSLARCRSLAIDPDFEITQALEFPTQVFKQTSDAFFTQRDLARELGGPFDLAFVDGLHTAENALRDFIHLEPHAAAGAVVVIDDVLPESMIMAGRERKTQAWTGDVYKVIGILRRLRPDLRVEVFDVELKGQALIWNLNPADSRLRQCYRELERAIVGDALALGSVDDIRRAQQPRPVEQLPLVLEEIVNRVA